MKAALALLLASATSLVAQPLNVSVSPFELVEKPVNPMIYGNFIELGFGRQVEGMWAEMFFNRSFEEVPAYRPNHWGWLRRGPEDDLSKEVWWHSGYEENRWYLVPGVEDTALEYVDHGLFRTGEWGAVLCNRNPTESAAFAQDGMWLDAGHTYEFTGWLRAHKERWDLGPTAGVEGWAEIRLYPEGDFSAAPIATARFDGITTSFKRFEATIDNLDFTGRATFTLWGPPSMYINTDDFSMMRSDNVKGWRRDVIEAARRVNAPIQRFPGGCFASFYNWREGIGPRAERWPRVSAFWGGLNDNDVGTIEFMEFCRETNAEPFLCVNMHTALAEDAAEWVAYCNAPADHPIGALRKRDGHEQPFDVIYWELDNETYRKYGPWEYAERCVEWSRAMKAVDPRIKTVIVVYANFLPHLEEMLAIAGKDIDLVTDRSTDEATLENNLAILARYNAEHGTSIQLCNTEWLPYMFDVPVAVDAFNRQPVPEEDTFQNRQIRWQYAMNAARQLLTFQRLGGDFVWANFNNFANTWGQNVLECPKEGVFLSPAGLVFELMSRSPAAWPITTEPAFPAENVEVRAAFDMEKQRLVVNTLNYQPAAKEVLIDLTPLDQAFTRMEGATLQAPDLGSRLTFDDRSAITRTEHHQPIGPDKKVLVTLPGYSVGQFILE
jgi:alpha-N-arabinofuranosidase